jgi:hypothetical protein
MRRSARFWFLKNTTLGAFEYDTESSPIPMIRSAVRIAIHKKRR